MMSSLIKKMKMLTEILHLFNPVSYFNLFKDILKSLRNPILQNDKPLSIKFVRLVIMITLISIPFKIGGLLINMLIEHQIGFDHKENKDSVLILIIILAPLLEELMFRLPHKFTLLNISISSSLIIGTIGLGSTIDQFLKKYALDTNVLAKFSLRMLCSAFFGLLLFNLFKKYQHRIINFGTNKFVFIFYTYTILFGFAHIANFQLTLNNFLYIIPLTLPQIFGGLFLGYTRINFGLKYSILQHSLWNLLVSLPTIIDKIN